MRLASLVLMAAAMPWIAFGVEGDFHWKGRVSGGQAIEIKGVNGPIRAEPSSGNEVEVSAVKTARRSDPSSVRIVVVPHGGGFTICAVYPDDGRRPNECRPGINGHLSSANNNDVNVQFVVKVPAGIPLLARTVNGAIEVARLRSDVIAETTNGKVRVETTGSARAKSVNGTVIAAIGRLDGMMPLEFETTNGSVELQLPGGANADIRASTVNGNISTDFPLTVSGKFGPKSIHGRLGSGGREIKLSTVNGRIALKRS